MARLATFLMLLVAPTTVAGVRWIPVAAHLKGVGVSVWRTDVALHNGCDQDAEVTLRLHGEAEEWDRRIPVAAGSSLVVEDVVAWLGADGVFGALEIVSDRPLTVRSRTYNLGDSGTLGQALDAVSKGDGIDFGRGAVIAGLQENAAFRSNIGIVNMGKLKARVIVELFDGSGASVGRFTVEIPSGRVVQANRPYRARFGRSDVTAGFARLTVERGTDVFAYGSVIDNESGDPTTVFMDRGTVQPLAPDATHVVEIALAAEAVPEGAALWVLGELEAGAVVRESSHADTAERLTVPGTGGPWYLVVVDPAPTEKYGHPMEWMLIDITAGRVVETVEVGYPPLIEPPSRPTGSFFTEVARGTVQGHSVRRLIGDGGPALNDHSHKLRVEEATVTTAAASPMRAGRSPVNIGLVMDGGGKGGKAMAENDADPMGDWLSSQGFEVNRYSQYLGNTYPYFETQLAIRKTIRAAGARLAALGSPGGGACDTVFLYIGAHGSTTKGKPNDGVDFKSVDAPGMDTTLGYDYLLHSFDTFPSHAKVTIFVDACYSGQLLQKKKTIAALCKKLCGLTLITTADAASTTAASNGVIDSSTEDFLEGANTDHDGDGNVGDIRDRYEEMKAQKVFGTTLSYHCPECTTWCVLDGPQQTKSACAKFSGTFNVTVTDIIDPAGHDGFDGDPLAGPLAFDFSCPSTTVSGPAPFVTVTGGSFQMPDGWCAFTATGRGTVAGFPDIAVLMEGEIDPESGHMEGRYTEGLEGGLPTGQAISYDWETDIDVAP